jgi:hypothetical protein
MNSFMTICNRVNIRTGWGLESKYKQSQIPEEQSDRR